MDHSTKILAISQIHPGSNSDEHISRLDNELQLIRFNALFGTFPFNLLSSPGVFDSFCGAYLIADGGYQAWRVLQMTFKYSLNTDLTRLYVLLTHCVCVWLIRTKVR